MTAELSNELLHVLKVRQQQITPCELCLSIVVPWNCATQLRYQDVIWFIDNQAACSLLIKGTSTENDLSWMAAAAHLMYAMLSMRVYCEFVPSTANCADGLSRDGTSDAWTQNQKWHLQQAKLPDFNMMLESSLPVLTRHLQQHLVT